MTSDRAVHQNGKEMRNATTHRQQGQKQSCGFPG